MFQSTSASAGRRYLAGSRVPRATRCFNPLRPALAEDTGSESARSSATSVSIHFGQRWPKILYVSSCCTSILRFNPLRPALAEDTIRGPTTRGTGAFQSTSASAGRRYDRILRAVYSSHWFQSTSASAGRRYLDRAQPCRGVHVSIHFGQRWPKIPRAARREPRRLRVSIHFGQRWPKILAMDAAQQPGERFNPLRPALAEDTGASRPAQRRTQSFNPLRPALAEDTPRRNQAAQWRDVSIHFGQRWPKIRDAGRPGHEIDWFQSTSASAGRRYKCPPVKIYRPPGFNPLRPALAEDTRAVQLLDRDAEVSIHFGQRWPKILSSSLPCAAG